MDRIDWWAVLALAIVVGTPATAAYFVGYNLGKGDRPPHIINCYDVSVSSHLAGVDDGLRACRDFIDAHCRNGSRCNFQTGELVK